MPQCCDAAGAPCLAEIINGQIAVVDRHLASADRRTHRIWRNGHHRRDLLTLQRLARDRYWESSL